jgi:hypothetical protein
LVIDGSASLLHGKASERPWLTKRWEYVVIAKRGTSLDARTEDSDEAGGFLVGDANRNGERK